ncbi:MAG TPA: hypothetical protein VEJ84_02775, partial [Acidimicrobiales bacterium]|nr:hypothetical protein [Acidimicrobiales bacterium]
MTTAVPARRRRLLGTVVPRLRAWLAVGALAAGTIEFYFWRLADLRPAGGNHPALVPLVFIGMWAASVYAVPVRNRRTSLAVSLAGIPMLVAVPFLSPAIALAAVTGGLFAEQLQHRRPFVKATVSCLAWAASLSGGILLYDRWLGHRPTGSLAGLAVGVTTLTGVAIFDFLLVMLTSSFITWRFRPPPLAQTSLHILAGISVCGVGGVTAIILMKEGTWDVALFGVVVAAGDIGWRRA